MQTESECGDGQNTWEYAEYVYRLMWHYFYNQAEGYIYWNMVLPEGGMSSWGWTQNSLFTISREKDVIPQPELYIMKHFSHFVKPGAVLLETKGRLASNAVVFENPNGEIVIVAGNSMNQERLFTFKSQRKNFSAKLEAHSIHSFIIGEKDAEI